MPNQKRLRIHVEGVQVHCYRENHASGDTLAVSFDAHLGEIAPHVAAALRPGELRELEAWLRKRRSVRSETDDLALLERLPSMLMRATDALQESESLPLELRDSLQAGVLAFSDALDVEPAGTPYGARSGDGTAGRKSRVVHEF